MTIKYLVLCVYALVFFTLKQCSKNPGEHKITVVGDAIAIMDRVGVESDDQRRYYLVVKDRHKWAEEYLGKRIKVTGILVPRKDNSREPYSDTAAVTQPRLRDGDTIRNARWKIVE